MHITVLDGNALNPGDLSWKPLEIFGQVTIYPRTAPEDVLAHIADSDAILMNKIQITEDILSKCPKLKYIGIQATGYNVVDIEACKRHNVVVTNVPSYSTAGVAQLTFAFITEFASKVSLHSKSVFAGDWIKSKDFCYWKAPLIELEGKTLGIFGYGNIGKKVATIAQAFGMNVLVCTRTNQNNSNIHFVDFESLLQDSDFISLHAPLTPLTNKIINATALSKMKPTAYIINTARGALVNEYDVAVALQKNIIAGYATDVLEEEPMKENNPLLNAPKDKILITPHIAWAATETRQRLLDIVIDNLASFIEGRMQNVIS